MRSPRGCRSRHVEDRRGVGRGAVAIGGLGIPAVLLVVLLQARSSATPWTTCRPRGRTCSRRRASTTPRRRWSSTTAAPPRGAGPAEEAIAAAEAIGDDAIQQQSGRPVNPETWTHGSSEQRQTWFRRGFDTGDPNQCDTFAQ